MKQKKAYDNSFYNLGVSQKVWKKMKRSNKTLFNEFRAKAFLEQMEMKHSIVLGQIKDLPDILETSELHILLEACKNRNSDLFEHTKFHENFFLKFNLQSIVYFCYSLDEELKDWGKKVIISSILLLEEQYCQTLDFEDLLPKDSKSNNEIKDEPQMSCNECLTENGYKEESTKSFTGKTSRTQIVDKISNNSIDNNVIIETASKRSPDSSIFIEGAERDVCTTRYERDHKARQQCIKIHGTVCAVCGIDFEKMYGELGKGFIHIHHIVPIHTIGEGYKVNPATDLIPVCPNCHAMLHRGMNGEARSVEELKTLLKLI